MFQFKYVQIVDPPCTTVRPPSAGRAGAIAHQRHEFHGRPQVSQSTADRRTSRRRQLKAAIIAFNGRHVTLPCRLRDISDTGARLEVDTPSVPDTFELIVEMDGLEAACEVIWRRQSVIGVRFVGPPSIGRPKRTQVVQALVPQTQPTLRRKPSTPSGRP